MMRTGQLRWKRFKRELWCRTTSRHCWSVVPHLAAHGRQLQHSISGHLLPASRRQQFSIVHKAWEVVRSRSMNPPNPLLDGILPAFGGDDGDVASASKKPKLPNFAHVMPYHLVEAAEKVLRANQDELSRLEQDCHDMENSVAEPDRLLRRLDRLDAASFYMANVATLYMTLHQTPEWELASSKVHGMLVDQPHLHSTIVREALKRISNDAGKMSKESQWLVQYYLQHFSNMTGVEDDSSSLQQFNAALQRLESEVMKRAVQRADSIQLKQPSPAATKEQLELIHTYLAVQHQRARLSGFAHYADLILQSPEPTSRRLMKTVSDVTSLHRKVANHITPVIQSTPVQEWQDATEGTMLDTSEYLTLEGMLVGLIGLSYALFGIRIREETDFDRGWCHDVRLFHIYSQDDKHYVASFYLDPYSRPIKMLRPFMNPLLGSQSSFFSCRIRSPMWDDLPTALRMEDAIHLVHEFGHVLQFCLVGSDKTMLGAQNLPIDLSEIMPHFMEHWLFDRSVLQSFSQLSQSTMPDEAFDTLQKQRSFRKANDLLRHTFLSQLEFEMFSNAKGVDESLVSFQRRIAIDCVPHELPARGDLTPMLEVVENNVKGKRIAQCRYLYGEVLGAELFDLFRKADIKDQEVVRKLGGDLREALLLPGASVDPSKVVQSILGLERDISTETMFNLYGLSRE